MNRCRVGTAALAATTVVHAAVTWPTVAVFVGGGAVAAGAELLVVRAGLLEHRLSLQVGGVPVAAVLAWPVATYLCYRLASVVADGVPAAAVAALIAAATNAVIDQKAVADGVWHYPAHPLSTPRFRGVPWWNAVGWFGLVFVAALVPASAGL